MTDVPVPVVDAGDIPAQVAQLAADRGLGEYVGQRGWGDPRKKVGLSLLAVVVAVVGEILIVRLLGLFFLHLFMLFLFIGGISNTIAALARGRQQNYLFTLGLVHSKKNELHAIEWPQVARLGMKVVGSHGMTGGRRALLHLQDGRSISIPVSQQTAAKDPFIQSLLRLLRQHGRPIE